jgi:hypothetical protein
MRQRPGDHELMTSRSVSVAECYSTAMLETGSSFIFSPAMFHRTLQSSRFELSKSPTSHSIAFGVVEVLKVRQTSVRCAKILRAASSAAKGCTPLSLNGREQGDGRRLFTAVVSEMRSRIAAPAEGEGADGKISPINNVVSPEGHLLRVT